MEEAAFVSKANVYLKNFVPIQDAPQGDNHPDNCGIVTQDILANLMLKKLTAKFLGVRALYQGVFA